MANRAKLDQIYIQSQQREHEVGQAICRSRGGKGELFLVPTYTKVHKEWVAGVIRPRYDEELDILEDNPCPSGTSKIGFIHTHPEGDALLSDGDFESTWGKECILYRRGKVLRFKCFDAKPAFWGAKKQLFPDEAMHPETDAPEQLLKYFSKPCDVAVSTGGVASLRWPWRNY
jgi:proteasome lid subunit RPN8/RPN11